MLKRAIAWCAGLLLFLALTTCGARSERTVIVYVALDRHLAAPVLDAFTAKTGIAVRPLYDTEASKTTGLANRIISEAKGRTRCDVFWNNEVLHTIRLQKLGLTQAYLPRGADGIPARFKDPGGHWTGFAARARVLIVNTNLVPSGKIPHSVRDLADPAWKGRTCIARPLFGTTATHATALFALDGTARARRFFQDLLDNDVAILLGNATVRDLVANGTYAFGLTDTDDAYGAIHRGDPVKMIFPDQGENERGTLVIPNTVCLIAGAPHPDEARALIDFLISATCEEILAAAEGRQIPLRPGVPVPKGHVGLDQIKAAAVDYNELASVYEPAKKWLQENFRR